VITIIIRLIKETKSLLTGLRKSLEFAFRFDLGIYSTKLSQEKQETMPCANEVESLFAAYGYSQRDDASFEIV